MYVAVLQALQSTEHRATLPSLSTHGVQHKDLSKGSTLHQFNVLELTYSCVQNPEPPTMLQLIWYRVVKKDPNLVMPMQCAKQVYPIYYQPCKARQLELSRACILDGLCKAWYNRNRRGEAKAWHPPNRPYCETWKHVLTKPNEYIEQLLLTFLAWEDAIVSPILDTRGQ